MIAEAKIEQLVRRAEAIDARLMTPLDTDIGSVTVKITARDPGGATASDTFTINVPLNHTPQFTKGADQVADEDSGPQVVLNWATNILKGPPDEATQTVNFTVTTNNDALFSVLPTITPTGTLSYTSAPNTYGTATITVTLKDNGGNAAGGVDTSDPQTFSITIAGINDPPSFTKGADVTVLEDSGNQSVVGWATNINAGPNEASQIVSFTVTTNNNQKISRRRKREHGMKGPLRSKFHQPGPSRPPGLRSSDG